MIDLDLYGGNTDCFEDRPPTDTEKIERTCDLLRELAWLKETKNRIP